jgi:FtsH-binding integral membrane protein
MRRPRINGAKGVALLGYSIVAGIFGVALLSPWALIPPPPPGLVFLDSLVPLRFWGGVWWVTALLLIIGAFRKSHTVSLGLFAAILFVWSASYGFTAFTVAGKLATAYSLQATIFAGLLVSVLATARLHSVQHVANVTSLHDTLRNELRYQEEKGDGE